MLIPSSKLRDSKDGKNFITTTSDDQNVKLDNQIAFIIKLT